MASPVQRDGFGIRTKRHPPPLPGSAREKTLGARRGRLALELWVDSAKVVGLGKVFHQEFPIRADSRLGASGEDEPLAGDSLELRGQVVEPGQKTGTRRRERHEEKPS